MYRKFANDLLSVVKEVQGDAQRNAVHWEGMADQEVRAGGAVYGSTMWEKAFATDEVALVAQSPWPGHAEKEVEVGPLLMSATLYLHYQNPGHALYSPTKTLGNQMDDTGLWSAWRQGMACGGEVKEAYLDEKYPESKSGRYRWVRGRNLH